MIRNTLLIVILSCTLMHSNYTSAQNDSKNKKSIRIVCFGDSITKAKRVSRQESFIGILENKFKTQGYSVEFFNAGVGGDTTVKGLKRLDKTVLALNPDIVTIMFGCNDSYKTKKMTKSRVPLNEFKKNLKTIINALQKRNIKPILMTTTPTITPNNIVEPYVQAVRDIAKEKNLPLVDHFKIWENYKNKGNNYSKILFDIAHPNQPGYIIMSDAMYPVLLKQVKEKIIR